MGSVSVAGLVMLMAMRMWWGIQVSLHVPCSSMTLRGKQGSKVAEALKGVEDPMTSAITLTELGGVVALVFAKDTSDNVPGQASLCAKNHPNPFQRDPSQRR